MPNYVNKFIDPSQSQQQGIQNVLQAAQIGQARKRNELQNDLARKEGEREQTRFDVEMMTVPYKFNQIKSQHVSQIAKNLIAVPKQARARKYSNLVNIVVPTPIAEHPQLGGLGVGDPEDFLPINEFIKLSDEQQKAYLQVVSYTAEDLAKINLSDKNAHAKEREISMRATNELKKIRTQTDEDIRLDRAKTANRIAIEKEKAKLPGSAAGDKTQTRIDKLHKEIANLAKAREQIRRGDKMDQLANLFAMSQGKEAVKGATNTDEAISKLDDYERWLRKELRNLESGATGPSGEDPLNLFGGNSR